MGWFVPKRAASWSTKARLSAALLLLLGCAGCVADSEPEAEPEPQWRSLVDPTLWLPVQVESPFIDESGNALPCNTEQGVVVEELNLETVLSVMTQFCSFVTVEQPLLHAVDSGDTLRVRFWHSELTAPDDSVAHASVLIAGQPIWSEQFPIPMEGEYIDAEFPALDDFEQGQDVWFHVDNHGANEYSLIDVSAR